MPLIFLLFFSVNAFSDFTDIFLSSSLSALFAKLFFVIIGLLLKAAKIIFDLARSLIFVYVALLKTI